MKERRPSWASAIAGMDLACKRSAAAKSPRNRSSSAVTSPASRSAGTFRQMRHMRAASAPLIVSPVRMRVAAHCGPMSHGKSFGAPLPPQGPQSEIEVVKRRLLVGIQLEGGPLLLGDGHEERRAVASQQRDVLG